MLQKHEIALSKLYQVGRKVGDQGWVATSIMLSDSGLHLPQSKTVAVTLGKTSLPQPSSAHFRQEEEKGQGQKRATPTEMAS